MHKYRFIELLCIGFTVVFVFCSMSGSTKTIDMTAAEISEKICDEECSTLISRDRSYVKEKLGIDTQDFVDFVYCSSDDIMDVREIFIAVSENEISKTVFKAIEDYRTEKFNLYNGYAPDAALLLKNAVFECRDNILIFAVSDNADAVYSAFNSLY